MVNDARPNVDQKEKGVIRKERKYDAELEASFDSLEILYPRLSPPAFPIRMMQEFSSSIDEIVDDIIESLEVELLRRHLYRPPDFHSSENAHALIRRLVRANFGSHLDIMRTYIKRNVFDARHQLQAARLRAENRRKKLAISYIIPVDDASFPNSVELEKLQVDLVSLRRRLSRAEKERAKLRILMEQFAKTPEDDCVRDMLSCFRDGKGLEHKVQAVVLGSEALVDLIGDGREQIRRLGSLIWKVGAKNGDGEHGKFTGAPHTGWKEVGNLEFRFGAATKRIQTLGMVEMEKPGQISSVKDLEEIVKILKPTTRDR